TRNSGDASWYHILKALEKVVEYADKWAEPKPMVSVVNLSFNGNDNLLRSKLVNTHKLIRCIEKLKQYNIPVVVSSGNNFERFKRYGLGYPAYHSQVISVGSVVNYPFEDYAMDTIAPFSQRIPPFTKNT